MISACTLLDSLEERGFTVVCNGEAVRVAPKALLTSADRQLIVHHKQALLALLRLRSLAADCVPCEFPTMLRPTRALMNAHRAAEAATGERLTLNGLALKVDAPETSVECEALSRGDK